MSRTVALMVYSTSYMVFIALTHCLFSIHVLYATRISMFVEVVQEERVGKLTPGVGEACPKGGTCARHRPFDT